MSGAILRKSVKDVVCEEWGWVTGRVVSIFYLNITKVAEFGSGVSARSPGTVAGAEQVSNRNMTTNDMSKAPSKSIYIGNNVFTSVNDSEMIT